MDLVYIIFIIACMFLIMNYVIGLVQVYSPESLPLILRGNKQMNFSLKIYFNGLSGVSCHEEIINGRNIEQVKTAVLDEINKKKFISLDGNTIIQTSSIIQVYIKEEAG